MIVLVLNSGSSSLKTALADTSGAGRIVGRASAERIGEPGADYSSHEDAFLAALDTLQCQADVRAVGHRFVHGGERFREAVVIDDAVEAEIRTLIPLAPLHMPHHLKGYAAARRLLPGRPNVAVFDTAFHATIPPEHHLYAIPPRYHDDHGIRRYGFHGTSHRYVTGRYAALRGGAPEEFRLITCHLGNGASVTAVDRGRSIDTSMGFTPLEGLVMGTRSGDLDPAVVLYLIRDCGMQPDAVDALLNRESGLAGVSGLSNDMRTLCQAADAGHAGARLAVAMFCYRARKYIGAYLAALNGADGVVFTGGIGENAAGIREGICGGLDALGIRLDPDANRAAAGTEALISRPDSPVEVRVIPTQEELVIARDTAQTTYGLR
ncbi:MAG: acetate kinase [Bryobacterales bacterium]|nr:acetate kinase [Bryobacterales bacterium]